MTANKKVKLSNVDNNAGTFDATEVESGAEGYGIRLVPPALQYKDRLKDGEEAEIAMNENGEVTYFKMLNYTPQNKTTNKNSSFIPTKKVNTTPTPFRNANNYKPKEEYHYISNVEKLEGVTLDEYKHVYNEMSKKVWITASQVFQTPLTKSVEGETKILYDIIIYFNVKRNGPREAPEVEETPW